LLCLQSSAHEVPIFAWILCIRKGSSWDNRDLNETNIKISSSVQ
jgi:hypothetical protein